MNAYNTLANSITDRGGIPLSELKCYSESIGLIGSFREFVCVIYAMSDCYSEHNKPKETKPEQEL